MKNEQQEFEIMKRYRELAGAIVKMAIHDYSTALYNIRNNKGDELDVKRLHVNREYILHGNIPVLLFDDDQRTAIIEQTNRNVKKGLVYSYGKEDWIKPKGKARYF